MAATNHWTRDQLPFGKFDKQNKTIVHYATLINRTPSTLAMKLSNLASLDPFIIDSGAPVCVTHPTPTERCGKRWTAILSYLNSSANR